MFCSFNVYISLPMHTLYMYPYKYANLSILYDNTEVNKNLSFSYIKLGLPVVE